MTQMHTDYRAVSFRMSRTDSRLIKRIIDRAVREHGIDADDPQALNMDVSACHVNGCPLDLRKLLAADDASFLHDLYGIRRHLNRKTGALQGNFVPRCAKPASVLSVQSV